MASYPKAARRRASREGSIYYVESEKRWRAALTWTDEAGKRHRRQVSGPTQAGVRKRLGELRTDLERGMAPILAGTVGSFLAGWLERERQRIRPSTWRGRELHVRRYLIPALGSVSLTKLTPAHVERMTADLVGSGRSPRTASHARVTLRRALSDAVRDGLVHRNVAALARPPRVRRRTIEPGRDYDQYDGNRQVRHDQCGHARKRRLDGAPAPLYSPRRSRVLTRSPLVGRGPDPEPSPTLVPKPNAGGVPLRGQVLEAHCELL